MTNNFKKERLLVIAPHPDDEILGCGGLIKKIKDGGGNVFVLYLTVGDTKDFSKKGLSTSNERQREIEKVAKLLKFDDYHLAYVGNDYHLKLDTLGQKVIIEMIERTGSVSIENSKPTIVAFPSTSSYNQDHRVAAYATHAALRPVATESKHLVKLVLSFEAPHDQWSLNRQPALNYFVRLNNNEINAKLSALRLYKSQLRLAPNPRSLETIKALAILRGSQSGSNFAEAFYCYRNIG